MFMARHRRSARGAAARGGPVGPASGRQALWVNTLERRYDFHLGEAIRAAVFDGANAVQFRLDRLETFLVD